MKKFQLLILVLLICYQAAPSIASERLYVSDSFTITLRTGPSTENKIIRILNSGQALDVLEVQDKWSHVTVVSKNGTGVEGWVLNQYLMDRVPYETQAKALLTENIKLKDDLTNLNSKFSTVEKDNKDTSAEYNQTRSELVSLKKDYEALKNASSEYLSLKAEYDSNLLKIKSDEEKLNELETENSTIKKSQNHMWFAVGAVVLLFGLIIGSIIGRQSRKRTSSYY